MTQQPARPTTSSPQFGGWTLTLLVIANMIGAGVFTTSGFSLAELRSPVLVMLAWLLAGFIAICGAYSYGQLVKLMPESGGEYLFLARSIHPLAGYVAGWVSLIAGFTGAIAFAATALESYLLPAGSRPDWLPADAIAILAVVTAGLLHGNRPALGARVQNVTVAAKLLFLAVFIGLAFVSFGRAPELTQPQPTGQGPSTWIAFAVSIVWISLSYSGYNAAVYLAGEAVDARQSVPRALLRGTLCVTLIYLLLNAIFVYATPVASIAGQEDVATISAEWLGGPNARWLVQAIVCFALWSSIMSMLMAAPRVYAKMADDGLFPSQLRLQDAKPLVATLTQVVLAIIIILASRLENLLGYLGLTLSLSSAATIGCLFLPRYNQTAMQRVIAAVFVVSTLSLGVIFAWSRPAQFAAAAMTFACGAAMYGLTLWWSRSAPVDRSAD